MEEARLKIEKAIKNEILQSIQNINVIQFQLDTFTIQNQTILIYFGSLIKNYNSCKKNIVKAINLYKASEIMKFKKIKDLSFRLYQKKEEKLNFTLYKNQALETKINLYDILTEHP